MPVIPSGAAAWVRTVEHTDYGGHLEKADALNRGPLDPLTDVGAAQFTRLVADVPAMVRTVPFAVLSFGCVDTPDVGAPIIGGYFDGEIVTAGGITMMTGDRKIAYAGNEPPAGFPSASRVSDGVIDIEFAASYLDPYGVEGAFSISHVKPGSVISTAVCRVVATVTSATTVRVSVFDSADAAVPNARVSAFRVY